MLTQIRSLPPSHAQRHAASEIERMRLPLLGAVLAQRAAYEEIGLSGLPPHYADAKRETVAKAIAELNMLRAEIIALVNSRQSDVPPLTVSGAA